MTYSIVLLAIFGFVAGLFLYESQESKKALKETAEALGLPKSATELGGSIQRDMMIEQAHKLRQENEDLRRQLALPPHRRDARPIEAEVVQTKPAPPKITGGGLSPSMAVFAAAAGAAILMSARNVHEAQKSKTKDLKDLKRRLKVKSIRGKSVELEEDG